MKSAKPYTQKKRWGKYGKELKIVESAKNIPKEYDHEKEIYVAQDVIPQIPRQLLEEYLKYNPCDSEDEIKLRKELIRFQKNIERIKEKGHFLSTLDFLVSLLFPTMDKVSILKGLNDRLEIYSNAGILDIDGICQFVFHASFMKCQILNEVCQLKQTEPATAATSYKSLPEWEKIEKVFEECDHAEQECDQKTKSGREKSLFPKFFREKIVPILAEKLIDKEEREKNEKSNEQEEKKRYQKLSEQEKKKRYQKLSDQKKEEIRSDLVTLNNNHSRNYKRAYDQWKADQHSSATRNSAQMERSFDSEFYKVLWLKREWPPLY